MPRRISSEGCRARMVFGMIVRLGCVRGLSSSDHPLTHGVFRKRISAGIRMTDSRFIRQLCHHCDHKTEAGQEAILIYSGKFIIHFRMDIYPFVE